ncbi:MAG: rRNA pseudouridine synthase [candidate division Zixibacteria bacterium]|nr:rRNA pseudouridine synthase [candidate division Zixibacteria bacterium]
MRINKYLARSGVASRRHADNLILQGRVKVNGNSIKQLGVQVHDYKDIVEVDGRIVSPEKGTYYIMLNKPPGFLVSTRDPHHKRLVTSLLKGYKGKVFPVGRLDFDSSGLLIFTNDGMLAFRLSHPRYQVNKTYEVKCKGAIEDSKLRLLEKGVMLEDGITAPAKTRLLSKTKESSTVQITIHEGRKRQVRRMFKNVGHPVTCLKRVSFGNLKLGTLAEGKFMQIKKSQLIKLKNLVGLK